MYYKRRNLFFITSFIANIKAHKIQKSQKTICDIFKARFKLKN